MKRCAPNPAFVRHGFSLVELLVTVGIIAVLLGIAMPVTAQMRKQAQFTQALSNMRQLGMALVNYAGEHNGQVPRDKVQSSVDTWNDTGSPAAATVWYNALPRMVGKKGAADYRTTMAGRATFYTSDNLAYCPAAKYPAKVATLNQPYFAIAMNSKLNEANLHMIQAPAKTAIFLESGLPGETKTFATQSSYNGQPAVFASRFIARYGGSGLLTFADGHAESLPAETVVNKSTGKAYVPQPGADNFNPATSPARVVWTADPNANPNE